MYRVRGRLCTGCLICKRNMDRDTIYPIRGVHRMNFLWSMKVGFQRDEIFGLFFYGGCKGIGIDRTYVLYLK